VRSITAIDPAFEVNPSLEAPLNELEPVPDAEALEEDPVAAVELVPAEAMVPKGVVEVETTLVEEAGTVELLLALALALFETELEAVEEVLPDDVAPAAPMEKVPLVA